MFTNSLSPHTRTMYTTGGLNCACAMMLYDFTYNSVLQSKNAVCANITHNRYFHLISNFRLIHYYGKRLYEHMFDMVDTAFRYWTALIVY